MTREDASRHLHNDWYIENGHLCVYESARDLFLEAVGMGIKALRPVSREQVERIWFREPYTCLETKHGENGDIVYSAANTCMACGYETPIGNFCHNCGAAQTREAVEMVLERLEALKDGKDRSI